MLSPGVGRTVGKGEGDDDTASMRRICSRLELGAVFTASEDETAAGAGDATASPAWVIQLNAATRTCRARTPAKSATSARNERPTARPAALAEEPMRSDGLHPPESATATRTAEGEGFKDGRADGDMLCNNRSTEDCVGTGEGVCEGDDDDETLTLMEGDALDESVRRVVALDKSETEGEREKEREMLPRGGDGDELRQGSGDRDRRGEADNMDEGEREARGTAERDTVPVVRVREVEGVNDEEGVTEALVVGVPLTVRVGVTEGLGVA